jgi:hypothetical protein
MVTLKSPQPRAAAEARITIFRWCRAPGGVLDTRLLPSVGMLPQTMLFLALAALSSPLLAQQSADHGAAEAQTPPQPEQKRLFGIIPNYRTSPSLAHYQPLTTSEKFKLASEDAFDRGTFLLAAGFAGESQITKANPSFGQGVEGYAHYFVTSYADWAIGDYMTEAVFPSLLRQDPRYFRRGTGSGLGRLTYAMSQIFRTHTDSGGHAFNFSELGGNAAAAAISQAYYPENRDAASAASKFAIQIGVDMASNVMKEFYPDLRHWLSRRSLRHQAREPRSERPMRNGRA